MLAAIVPARAMIRKTRVQYNMMSSFRNEDSRVAEGYEGLRRISRANDCLPTSSAARKAVENAKFRDKIARAAMKSQIAVGRSASSQDVGRASPGPAAAAGVSRSERYDMRENAIHHGSAPVEGFT